MRIINFYKKVLAHLGLSVKDSGQIVNRILGDEQPTTIEGKPLYLPTESAIRESALDKVFFHPLDEISKADSPVLQDMVFTMNIRFNYITYIIMQSLLVMSESKQARDTLSPDAYPLLEALKDVDEQMIINFNKLMLNRLQSEPTKAVLRIHLKRGRTIDNVKYDRGSVVTFHLLVDLSTGSSQVNGVTLREKDIQTFKNLLLYIYPGASVDNNERYAKGINSNVAPFMESLLLTGNAIADKLNTVSEEFMAHIPEYESVVIDTSFMEDMSNVAEILKEGRSYLPVLRQGGAIDRPAMTERAPYPTRAPSSAPMPPPAMTLPPLPPAANPYVSQPTPMPTQAPVAVAPGKTSYTEYLQSRNAMPMPPGANQYGPPMGPNGYPPQPGYGGYPPPPPPQMGYGGYPQQPVYNGYPPQPTNQGYGGYPPPPGVPEYAAGVLIQQPQQPQPNPNYGYRNQGPVYPRTA